MKIYLSEPSKHKEKETERLMGYEREIKQACPFFHMQARSVNSLLPHRLQFPTTFQGRHLSMMRVIMDLRFIFCYNIAPNTNQPLHLVSIKKKNYTEVCPHTGQKQLSGWDLITVGVSGQLKAFLRDFQGQIWLYLIFILYADLITSVMWNTTPFKLTCFAVWH